MPFYKPLCEALKDVALKGPTKVKIPKDKRPRLPLSEYRKERLRLWEEKKEEEKNLIRSFHPYPHPINSFQENVNKRYYEAELKISHAIQRFRKKYYRHLIEEGTSKIPVQKSWNLQRGLIRAIRKSDLVHRVSLADIDETIEKEFVPYLNIENPRAFIEKVESSREVQAQVFKEEAKKHTQLMELAKGAAVNSFYMFVLVFGPTIMPGFKNSPFIKVVCDALQSVYETPNKRLQIAMPPRAGKSKIGSVLFPAWLYGKRPDWYVMHLCDTITSGSKFGGAIRDIITSDLFKSIFPNVTISDTFAAKDNWETTDKGVYRAIGANTGAAGKGGHVLIIDDLITEQTFKNAAILEKLFDIWPHGYESRLMEGGRIVIINTRWSVRDLSGWLLDRASKDSTLDQWEVLKIPAILDEESSKVIGLPVGSSFCPERWPIGRLDIIRRGMAQPYWLATYMQNPVALDGNIIKVENFIKFPTGAPLDATFILASADTAYSVKTTADYSVIQIWAVVLREATDSQGVVHKIPSIALLDQVRGRYEYPDLLAKCTEIEERYSPDTWLIEKKASGQCYDDKTEILTKDGWKLFKDVDISKDEFATRQLNTGILEYQKATHYVNEEYEGNLIYFKGKTLDLKVTPNHRMLVNSLPKKLGGHPSKRKVGETVLTAEELFTYGTEKTKVPLTSNWKGVEIVNKRLEPSSFTSGKRGKGCRAIEVSGDTYIKFMAAYLSEGWTQTNRGRQYTVHIGQYTKSKGYLPFKECLLSLGHPLQERRGKEMYVCNRKLYEFVRQFGHYCDEKRIPSDILNATPRQLKLFWDYYLLGDGHKTKKGYESISTTSKVLAGQLQELAQKMGYSASVIRIKQGEGLIHIANSVKPTDKSTLKPAYVVRLRTSKTQRLQGSKVYYKGNVYCVSVPNGFVYVRRNGYPSWSGNSLIQDMRRRGYFIHEFDPKGSDKITRAVSITPFIDAKRVMIPDATWVDTFENECRSFPKGAHDDTIDAFTQAVIFMRDNYIIDNYSGNEVEEISQAEKDDLAFQELTRNQGITSKGYW